MASMTVGNAEPELVGGKIVHAISKSDITMPIVITTPKAFKLRSWLAMRFIILAGILAPFTIDIEIEGEVE